jgi:hypothetical protein
LRICSIAIFNEYIRNFIEKTRRVVLQVRQITITSLLSVILLLFVCSCEHDGPVAMWDQQHNNGVPSEINGLEPADQAVAGINYITVTGSNFAEDRDFNFVYFNNSTTEIVSASETSLTVRRPNQTGDSIYVTVATQTALDMATYGPYQIDPVLSSYGNLTSGEEIGSIAIGADDKIYITQMTRFIYRIETDESTTDLGSSRRSVYDAKIGPGGRISMLMDYSRLYNFDPVTNEETEWIRLADAVTYGDYDQYGNFYASGIASGLHIVHPDTSTEKIDIFAEDTIACVRIYEDNVYLLVKSSDVAVTSPAIAIWKCALTPSSGTPLGAAALVLDWSQAGEYADDIVNTFTFSADGLMYIGTSGASPLLCYDMQQAQPDAFYKGIVEGPITKLVWSNGNDLYMVKSGETWSLWRIDMGTTGAPYYGRGL